MLERANKIRGETIPWTTALKGIAVVELRAEFGLQSLEQFKLHVASVRGKSENSSELETFTTYSAFPSINFGHLHQSC